MTLINRSAVILEIPRSTFVNGASQIVVWTKSKHDTELK
jgi:hypothetical protein